MCGCGGKKSPCHPHFLPLGTTLVNKYIVGRVLGHGGFGITYLGFDMDFHKQVAIKEHLPKDIAARSNDSKSVVPMGTEYVGEYNYGLKQFIEEGRALAKFIDNANIVSVLNYFKANNTAYLVMNYLEGTTLEQYLESLESKKLQMLEEDTVGVVEVILESLKVVHANGLLHRDIKPANIFITNKGQILLFDFGSARALMGRNSGDLSKIVTHGYSPIEQYNRRAKEGPWTDIYAVGATMYRMMTGKKPQRAIDRVKKDKIKPLIRILGNSVSITTSAVVFKALAVYENKRFYNVEQMLDALKTNSPVIFDSIPEKVEPKKKAPSKKINPKDLYVSWDDKQRKPDPGGKIADNKKPINASLSNSERSQVFWKTIITLLIVFLAVFSVSIFSFSEDHEHLYPLSAMIGFFVSIFISIIYSIFYTRKLKNEKKRRAVVKQQKA